jgi:uncharacterized protein with NAD-binding domain and iron-sulfur cluster
VRDLLPEQAPLPELSRIDELETAPISSAHLWFDRPILSPAGAWADELPHAVLIDRFSQWVFNRSLLERGGARQAAQAGGPDGYRYQVVISASRDVVTMSQADALAKVIAELAEIFPRSRAATLVHGRIVTEHRAVFSVRPGSDALRPDQRSSIRGLFLAGDWTRTGWPPTMEGAVRSGYRAAECVLAELGRPETLVQPDLPVSLLARWLLGLERASSPAAELALASGTPHRSNW